MRKGCYTVHYKNVPHAVYQVSVIRISLVGFSTLQREIFEDGFRLYWDTTFFAQHTNGELRS